MERKGMQVIKDVASKTAGLVFFSLLAIALGVVFGVMFERWIGGETGTPTTSTDLSTGIDEISTLPSDTSSQPIEVLSEEDTTATTPTGVKYRVRVGPYASYDQASEAANELSDQGYPVYLTKNAPYMVQVGAFANMDNALSLKTELTEKGFEVAIQPE